MNNTIQTITQPENKISLVRKAHENTSSLIIPKDRITTPSRLENVCDELGMFDVNLNEKSKQSTNLYHNLTVKVTPNHVRLSISPNDEYGVDATASLNRIAYMITGNKTYQN